MAEEKKEAQPKKGKVRTIDTEAIRAEQMAKRGMKYGENAKGERILEKI